MFHDILHGGSTYQFVKYLKINITLPTPALNHQEFYNIWSRLQELGRVEQISRYSIKKEVERRSLSLEELMKGELF
ncbi:MAG: hypothetical protein AOA65_0102 [Candidatus Bathyarchaeota archaeon BA1]|nr:MAG: hypothetical protein AOA65_0102 [Candidatus Bathyarchaeota archaeon BA1]